MAINLYLGSMGSGKTYEVVTVVIYKAILQGRNVITNIAGINQDAMLAYHSKHNPNKELGTIGQVRSVPHDDVIKPEFWRTDTDKKTGFKSVIEDGDLVVLDEVWRFWNGFSLKDDNEPPNKRPERFKNFIRMHRQLVADNGFTCDLAIITQDLPDVSRFVRGVVDETYMFTKLGVVGLDTKYRADVYAKTKVRGKPLMQFFNTYDKEKFPFYKSHSGAKEGVKPNEQRMDKRANILKSKLLYLVAAGFIALPFLVYNAMSFFTGKKNAQVADTAPAAQANAIQPNAAAQAAAPQSVGVSDTWRIVGYHSKDGVYTFVLRDSANNHRFVNGVSNYEISGLYVGALFHDGFFNNYQGAQIEGGIIK